MMCCLACWAFLGAELLLRTPDQYGFYVIEMLLALLSPFAIVAFADQRTVREYRQIWHGFSRRGYGQLIVAGDAMNRLREEMGQSILLRWLRPPVGKSIRSELLLAALWYTPLTSGPSMTGIKRHMEQLVDLAVLLLLVPAAAVLLVSSAYGRPSPAGLAAAGVALTWYGLRLLSLAVRRQAILDYFSAWRGSRITPIND